MTVRFTDKQQSLILQAIDIHDDREVRTDRDLTKDEAEFVVEYYRTNAADYECEVTWNCHTDAQAEFAERQYKKSIEALQRKLQRAFRFRSPPIVVDGCWAATVHN